MTKRYFLDSMKLLNANLIFVFLIALIGIIFKGGGILTYLSLLILLLQLIIAPGIYGYFVEIIKSGRNEVPFFHNVRKYFFNYVIATLLIGMPVLFIRLLFPHEWMIPANILIAIIMCFTVYIIPVVFIQHIGMQAIPLGLKFLLNNFKYSLPLCLLFLVAYLLKNFSFIPVIKISVRFFEGGNLLIITMLSYTLNWIFSYIYILGFLVASIILVKDSSRVQK